MERDRVQQDEHLACDRRGCLYRVMESARFSVRQESKERRTVESRANRSRSTFVDFEGIDDCKENLQ